MEPPRLFWDLGTAYDLFISLDVLHQPAEFGIRASWAAGMRARIPSSEREILEQAQLFGHTPLQWLYTLPAPKDGATALWSLGQIPPAERLPTLTLAQDDHPTDVTATLRGVAARGAWDADDQAAIRAFYQTRSEQSWKKAPSLQELTTFLNWWSHPAEFGERFLQALRVYHEVFFAEEEKRIRPALQAALERAQELAGQMPLPDLLEELSQGVRFDQPLDVTEVVLAPSYWCTPLIYYETVSPDRQLFLFGARPPDASLVPGELVPDALLQALKALSDPTRLRILHYLSAEALTPAELARRLRLRAPTVTHHLKALRLAGLVQLSVSSLEDKGRDCYATRPEAIAAAFAALQHYLAQGAAQLDEK
jgi:DNA-binding transcriptional ArsR family regulator